MNFFLGKVEVGIATCDKKFGELSNDLGARFQEEERNCHDVIGISKVCLRTNVAAF
jgi:hypothetical protein